MSRRVLRHISQPISGFSALSFLQVSRSFRAAILILKPARALRIRIQRCKFPGNQESNEQGGGGGGVGGGGELRNASYRERADHDLGHRDVTRI